MTRHVKNKVFFGRSPPKRDSFDSLHYFFFGPFKHRTRTQRDRKCHYHSGSKPSTGYQHWASTAGYSKQSSNCPLAVSTSQESDANRSRAKGQDRLVRLIHSQPSNGVFFSLGSEIDSDTIAIAPPPGSRKSTSKRQKRSLTSYRQRKTATRRSGTSCGIWSMDEQGG